ncbi:E3 ubiquitin-protein ligase chfr-like [Plakobranchus ocellatus]|uniref:E3 ubiquitin-protein ligase CHFR n=1 Tax=Plakobranchus ocellatus TaxID=259542 RepID=A0AAV3ZLR4_9GAST|nr:E3 ubiquitin-protein ligase chfr-like [Plakobranchus ocellatus]
MSSQTEGPWAQLVSTTDINSPPTPIHEDKFTIGRNSDCGISHAGNKLVSGNHCFIERDKCGKVWLYDTSRNGTLFNLKIKLGKGECRELSHGDEFHLVHKKDNADDDIGYLFQDLKALEAETSSEFDETQEYDYNLTIPDTNSTVTDEDANIVTAGCPVEKRKAAEKESSTGNKKLKLDEENPGVTFKAVDSSSSPSSTSEGQATSKADNRPGPSNTGNLSGHYSGQVKESKEDVIAETLVCIICHELLHDCISLQPCMHSFCSGCYSEWMELSQECPSCRLKVERINKNHIINNLVEAYLKVNPDKKRPDEDIQLLETKNKITRDMLYPSNKVTSSLEGSDTLYETGSSENNDDHDDENEDNSDDSGDGGANFDGFNPFAVNAFGVPYFAAHRGRPAARPVCRQCPDYNPATDPTAFIAAAQAGPSADPDAKRFPIAPLFLCKQRADHVLCLCCLQPMPDRRKEFNFRPDCSVPPQQCSLCYRSFCHAYWGCRKADCDGCLAKLKGQILFKN